MNEPQQVPFWLIPLFPVFFAGFWMFVTGVLSAAGGWHGLAERFREPPNPPSATARRFRMASADLVNGAFPLPVSYSGCLIVDLGDAGIHLRPWLPFRFAHPPLLIPWAQVEDCAEGRYFLRRAATVRLRGTGTYIRFYGAPGQAVGEGWRRYQAWAARAGGV